MSNRPRFTHTKFSNADGTEVSYGYRVSDDEMMTYGDMWEVHEDLDDLGFLRDVVKVGDSVVGELLSYMQSDRRGAYINGSWYEYDEIEHVVGYDADIGERDVTDAQEDGDE